MSDLQWLIAVIALFLLATVTLWWRARKDMFGAIGAGLIVIVIAALLLTVSGCTISPEYRPWMEAGIAADRANTVGSDPACIVRVRQPVVPGRIVAGFTHHSSCGDQDDAGEINQWEVVAIIPLGRKAQ